MVRVEQRVELAKFLRARRAAVTPSGVDGHSSRRRRTPGLRREEVAALAGVSVTWYTWLEQGRDIRCSIVLLERLSKALKLSESDTDYLFRLAGYPAPMQRSAAELDPSVQGVVDGFTAGPAFVVDPCFEVVAFNALADAVFDFDGYKGPFPRNHLWRAFMDPERRGMYLDWTDFVWEAVAFLRASYATRIGDEACERLIAALSAESDDFVRMWEEHRTSSTGSIKYRLLHRHLGRLTFTCSRLVLPAPPDHVAIFLSPAEEETVLALSRWSASQTDVRHAIEHGTPRR